MFRLIFKRVLVADSWRLEFLFFYAYLELSKELHKLFKILNSLLLKIILEK